MIVGWQASRSLRTDLALDALEQAIWARSASRPAISTGSSITSDRGVQYLAIRYTERLAARRVVNSVGSRGDSYDNAMAETHQRALQDGTRPQQGTVARPRRPRARHPRMGRLVQPPPALRRPRPHPTRRVRRMLLPSHELTPARLRLTPPSLHETRGGSARKRAPGGSHRAESGSHQLGLLGRPRDPQLSWLSGPSAASSTAIVAATLTDDAGDRPHSLDHSRPHAITPA